MPTSDGQRRWIKGAELASSLGTLVLGAGLAMLAPDRLKGVALPLVAAGLLVHALGMTVKHRLEARQGAPLWWESALFWACWACLAGLGLWIAPQLAR